MMNSGYEDMPRYGMEQTEHVQLIASLTMPELVQLDETLKDRPDVPETEGMKMYSPWERIVHHTLVEREKTLDLLRRYRPEAPEAPLYDEEAGPDAYIAVLRATAIKEDIQSHEYQKFPSDYRSVRRLAGGYVISNWSGTTTRLSGECSVGAISLEEFFASNLLHLVLTSRALAARPYDQDRESVIRQTLPGVHLDKRQNFEDSTRRLPIGREQIEALEEGIKNLDSYKSPVPDFMQCSPAQKRQIVMALGREWEELCSLVNSHVPGILQEPSIRQQRPLLYHSITDLREAIDRYPTLPPPAICRAFLRHPKDFQQELARRLDAISHETPSKEAVLRRVAKKNEQAIFTLLQDPDVKSNVLDLRPGDTEQITLPDAIIPKKVLESLVDKHLRLIGLALYAAIPEQNPCGFGFHKGWDAFNIGRLLHANFEGRLKNLSITRLPVTHDDLKIFLGKGYVPSTAALDKHAQLALNVDFHSTGRVSEPGSLRLLLGVRQNPSRDIIFKSKFPSRSAFTVAKLKRDASLIGAIVEAHNRRYAYRGHSPRRR